MEVCPYSYFQYCGNFCGSWVSFIITDEFSVRVQKLSHKLVSHELTVYLSVFNLLLTQWIISILSKGCKADNFEPHNSHSYKNIWDLRSNFVECESFLEINSPDILALCKTNLDDSIDSGNFSVTVYLPLSEKILLITYMVLQFMWRKDFLLNRTYL